MRSWIYDRAVQPLTRQWYRAVLERLEPGTRLLDVGVGTGGALVDNADLVRALDLRMVGIDIDRDYVATCTRRVAAAGLSDRVEVALQSLYDHAAGPYDAVYFGASFMLMPRPIDALKHAQALLADGGRVLFTQTFQGRRSRLAEWGKPLLVRLTTIDFGAVTYEEDFRRVVSDAGLELQAFEDLGAARLGLRYRLAEGVPAAGRPPSAPPSA